MVGKRQGVATRFVIKLSLLATLLSVMVMILTEAILVGFKQSIEHKVYAFWGHVSAEALQDRENYFMHQNYRADLIKMKEFLINSPGVKSFRAYGSKYGVLLSENSLDGVVFKGYQYSPKQEGFSEFLLRGHWIDSIAKDNQVVLSEVQSQDLGVDTGYSIVANFLDGENISRKRKLQVVGIYRTGIEMYDKNFVFVSLGLIQRLNNWNTTQFGGYEILLQNVDKISSFANQLFELSPEDWQVYNTRENFPNIFEWLALLDINQYIIIIIMFIVAVLNMATLVITLVMDRARMIVILKVFGASRRGIRQIFSYYAAFISLIGILAGNILGLLLGYLQNYYQIIKFNSSSYFVNSLHLVFNLKHILIIDIIVFVLCYLVLLLPSQLVYRQQVLKVLRF